LLAVDCEQKDPMITRRGLRVDHGNHRALGKEIPNALGVGLQLDLAQQDAFVRVFGVASDRHIKSC
jgi:hypothetical protein